MDTLQELQNHLDECRQMAKRTRDPESKAEWNQLAARWIMAVERQREFERQASVDKLNRKSKPLRRKPAPHVLQHHHY